MLQTRWPDDFPELETADLRLRQLVPADAEAVFQIFADGEVTRFYDLETFTTVGEAADLIARQRARFERGEGLRWGVTHKRDDRVIGTIGCILYKHNASGGLGYELARPYWRRGITSAALQAVISFGFDRMRLNRLQALVMPGNEASAGLLRKLGFQEEGLLREYAFFRGRFNDLRCFSLLAGELKRPKVDQSIT
jgi:ribosomal-protein-alanine N-acetyltransferase